MTEFTDGTAKGKTLSMMALSNQLEELNNQLTALPLVLHGKIENIYVAKNNGYLASISFNQAFKTEPILVACFNGAMTNWSNLALTTIGINKDGATVYIWNNTSEADITTNIEWIAIGERG